jgi:hypothetical protein
VPDGPEGLQEGAEPPLLEKAIAVPIRRSSPCGRDRKLYPGLLLDDVLVRLFWRDVAIENIFGYWIVYNDLRIATRATHSVGALYQAFPPGEARRLLRGLEFHFVPKHASWLNMAEIEIGVLRSQCLDRRIDSYQCLVSEIAAWERQRHSSRARIKWMFTTEKARAKMARAYPKLSTKES